VSSPTTRIAEKARKGFDYPEAPLVASGEMRDSVEDAALGAMAVAGSNDAKVDIHEHGLGRVPPRPTLLIGLAEAGPLAVEIAAEVTRARCAASSGASATAIPWVPNPQSVCKRFHARLQILTLDELLSCTKTALDVDGGLLDVPVAELPRDLRPFIVDAL
jgi:hypothetical protein